ncbi:MAG: hypothetical protein RSD29_00620 [Bacilli bacterium]
MKNYIKENKKGLIIVFIAIIITCSLGYVTANINRGKSSITLTYVNEEASTPRILSNDEKINILLEQNQDRINFYAKTFGIDSLLLKDKLKKEYNSLKLLDITTNIDLSIINYLLNLEDTNTELFNNTITNTNKDKDYIIGLINYFTKIYPLVDFKIAASIAEVESGFTAKTMLICNNIYGGFSRGSLIRYKNIEYGTLKYIILLNDGYFNKGLNTVSSIGYVYNPTINTSGVKVASPTWVNKVNNSLNKYNEYKSISEIKELFALQNN